MAKVMKCAAAASTVLLVLFAVLYRLHAAAWVLTMTITFGTVAYHFVVRLLVGAAVDRIMRNRADLRKRWYRVGAAELHFYEKLGVKRWKHRLPTYDASQFSPKEHAWEEIAGAMCQAEVVHEIIVLLSFLPLAAVPRFGALFVFLITSFCAALFDLQFVVLQRYNRPRVLRLMEKSGAAAERA